MKEKAVVDERRQRLLEMTAGFCGAYLDEEYKGLCEKLIGKMSRKRNVPFLYGRLDIWAAAVVYSLGQVNFLFDRSNQPYATADDICSYFGTSKSTTSQKAKVIRGMFKMGFWDPELSTADVKKRDHFANLVMVNGFIVDRRWLKEIGGLDVGLEKEHKQDKEEGIVTDNQRQFFDKDRPVMDAYYDICERFDGRRTKSIKKQLKGMIEKDPDFLDPYLMLYYMLLAEGDTVGAKKELDTAYERALNLITDEEGRWPDVLRWVWLENRHIIRTVLNKAIWLWIEWDLEGALDLFRRLLRSNPVDNVGARNYIMAIQNGHEL